MRVLVTGAASGIGRATCLGHLPEDIADIIALLRGPEARYVNRDDLIVDGGVSGNLRGRLPGLSQVTRGWGAAGRRGGRRGP